MDTTFCRPCLRRAEVADNLRGGDLTPEEWRTIRRRIEEAVRKSPAALQCAATALAGEGHIRIENLI
jgi:DNA-directed RNA polymerase specialized sigma subunit